MHKIRDTFLIDCDCPNCFGNKALRQLEKIQKTYIQKKLIVVIEIGQSKHQINFNIKNCSETYTLKHNLTICKRSKISEIDFYLFSFIHNLSFFFWTVST